MAILRDLTKCSIKFPSCSRLMISPNKSIKDLSHPQETYYTSVLSFLALWVNYPPIEPVCIAIAHTHFDL